MTTINDKVLTTLNTLSNTGKNATILLTIAKAINADKALPAWAEDTLGQQFFINVLTSSERTIAKVCKDDSYHDLRAIVNTWNKAQRLTVAQYETLKTLMTIKVFQNNEVLKDIKAQAEMVAALAVTKALIGCHDVTITGNEVQKKQAKATDYFSNLEAFKAGIDTVENADDLALMLEIIQARLNAQAQAQHKKVA